MDSLDVFIKNLHYTSKVLVVGHATVMGMRVDAVLVRNLYRQNVVWGMFSVEKGKFKGKLANNANTDGVVFHFPRTLTFDRVSLGTYDPKVQNLLDQWSGMLQSEIATKH